MDLKRTFWQGRRVAVTGHAGFKGAWLTLALSRLGAKVIGLSTPPEYSPSMMSLIDLRRFSESIVDCDVRNLEVLASRLREFDPQTIFHLAAQPLVRASYARPVDTFEVNVMGTLNVLEAARSLPALRSCVVVTTDKVYENTGELNGYAENARLGGHDPYSASKAASELVSASYAKSFFSASKTGIATARAGNVIGGGDWSQDRLIPDFVRAADRAKPLLIRNPAAIRPWQHVIEPVIGYLLLAQRIDGNPHLAFESFNFGPDPGTACTVSDVLEELCKLWGAMAPKVQIEGTPTLHEASVLTLDNAQAKSVLGWRPSLTLQETLALTARWYLDVTDDPARAAAVTLEQIDLLIGTSS